MRLLLVFLLLGAALPAAAADPGRDVIGKVTVEVFFGTNGDPAVLAGKGTEVDEATVALLAADGPLKFDHYRKLGGAREALYRSYENWAEPIAGSDEILCRFEVAGRVSEDVWRLDLELWLQRKKVLKTGAALAEDRPVLVLGPGWRGGRLIVAVALAPAGLPGS